MLRVSDGTAPRGSGRFCQGSTILDSTHQFLYTESEFLPHSRQVKNVQGLKGSEERIAAEFGGVSHVAAVFCAEFQECI